MYKIWHLFKFNNKKQNEKRGKNHFLQLPTTLPFVNPSPPFWWEQSVTTTESFFPFLILQESSIHE
jgi:hypothetical protein